MCNTAKVTIKFNQAEFNKADLKAKTEYVLRLRKAQQELDDAFDAVKDKFTQAFRDSRNDITETIRVTTDLGVVELPSGYAEKRLKDAEVQAFVKALKKINPAAYELAVDFVAKIKKTEINKLRVEVGATKSLIDETYRTTDEKPLEYTLDTAI
jgi:hypothetical protein